MGRVTVHVADTMLSALDEEAHNRNISRSQAAAKAIEFFITGNSQAVLDAHNELSEAHNKLSASEEEVKRLKQQLLELNKQLAKNGKSLESSNSEVMHLNEEVKRIVKLQEEAEHNKDDYEALRSKYDQVTSENSSRWEETKALKTENTKLKKDLDEARSASQHLKDDLLKRQAETDLLAKAREELAAIKSDRDRLQEAMKVRDDDIGFLRGHVAQLTQSISQLALRPGDEEIKKKGWWQFWR
jgi:chromosome segregation ATPase